MSEVTEERIAAEERQAGELGFAKGATGSTRILDIPERAEAPKAVRDPEFIIGAAVLSAVGGIFLLVALMLVWVNYMNSFAKGMSLYLLSAVFLSVSEILVRRKLPKLSYVLTSVGIGGIYVSTMVNYRWLHHFREGAGVLVVAVFTVLVLLYGWARNVPWYRIAGLLFFYPCLLMGELKFGDDGYFVVLAVAFAVSLVGALLPLRRQAAAVTSVSMLAMVLLFKIPFRVDESVMIQGMIHVMGALFVLHLLLHRQLKLSRDIGSQDGMKASGETGRFLSFSCYLISLFFLYLRLAGVAFGRQVLFSGALQACMLGIGIVCAVSFAILLRFKEKWSIYYFANIVALTVYGIMELRDERGIAWGGWCLVAMLLLAQLLSLRKERLLWPSQAIITALSCMTVLIVSDRAYTYVLAAVLLLSVLLVYYWHTYYELTVTYTLALLFISDLPMMLVPPVFVGTLFVGVILVNNVGRLRGRFPLAYNWAALSGQIVAYFSLMFPIFRNSYLTHFCMAVLGLAVIWLVLDEKYGLRCRFRLFFTELFLVYIVLVLRLEPSVFNSILLMGIALVGVGGGFALREKNARICGLIISLLVCGKIVLYDFRGGVVTQRILLFLVTGLIALIIGGIYIVLEKKTREKQDSPR